MAGLLGSQAGDQQTDCADGQLILLETQLSPLEAGREHFFARLSYGQSRGTGAKDTQSHGQSLLPPLHPRNGAHPRH